MSDDPVTHSDDPTLPDLPQPLRAELSRLYRADASASTVIDQKILNRARAHFARRGRLRLLAEVGAVAAVILIVIGIVVPMLSRTDHGMLQVKRESSGDVNIDGVVDIRDALLLARRIEQKQTRPINDYNRDGVVDARDVDAVAMMAVKIEKGTAR